AHKALGPGKAHAIAFISASVQDLDSFLGQHANQLDLAVALIIMVPEYDDYRQAQPHQHIQQRLHFIGLAVVGQVASHYKHVGLVANAVQLIMQGGEARWREMQIGGGCNSHRLLVPDFRTTPSLGCLPAVFRKCSARYRLCRFSSPHSFRSMAKIFSSTTLPRKGAFGLGCWTRCM